MLTHCPACETRFRVSPEQLKARSGRVRCGACQKVFNALDNLIEEPTAMAAPLVAAVPPASEAGAAEPEVVEPEVAEPEVVEPEIAVPDWAETFSEPPPPPRRWPWVIGSLVALGALSLQAILAFRVELAVLWPEVRPALVTLCGMADCEVGLPTKVALVGIEASDLNPDSAQKNRLALTATLRNRAPFTQKFPHLELTLTDTADQALARKALTPADYLPPKTSLTDGMPPNADIVIAVAVESGEIAASGYRLYLFYP